MPDNKKSLTLTVEEAQKKIKYTDYYNLCAAAKKNYDETDAAAFFHEGYMYAFEVMRERLQDELLEM